MEKKWFQLLVLFILFYTVMYFVSTFTEIQNWDSPMFYLIPIPAFFFLYFLVDWVNETYKTKLGLQVWYPIAFLVVSLLAYFVAVYWYYHNIHVVLSGLEQPVFDYFAELKQSAFLQFIVFGLLGWVSRIIIEKVGIEGKKDKDEEKEAKKDKDKKEEKEEKENQDKTEVKESKTDSEKSEVSEVTD
ncbi:MAG: hypothetical protein ABH821_05660 [archaeon]